MHQLHALLRGLPRGGQLLQFLGPAAIALGHRYSIDSRDEGAGVRNQVFRGEGTVFLLYANECSEVCPSTSTPPPP